MQFHCCGSSFHLEQKCYTYAPSYVKVAKLLITVLTTVCLYTRLTVMMQCGILFHFWISIRDSWVTYTGGGTGLRIRKTNASERLAQREIYTKAG